MDSAMIQSLTERDMHILTSVVREFILTAEPVSSRKIAIKYGVDLSPATIRTVMADLEDMGLLHQPHTSAGRVPTQAGLRLYVNSIMKYSELPSFQKEAIREKYQHVPLDISHLLRKTSKILSEFSQAAGLVLAPRIVDTVFKRIDFLRLRKDSILAIFISRTGLVQTKAIAISGDDLTQDDLDKASHYLNSVLTGLTLREVRRKILEEMEKEQIMYNRLLSCALRMGEAALKDEKEFDVYIEGQTTFLDYPEFATVEKMKAILKTLEEKSILVSILDKALEAEGVRIFIGSENEYPEVADCTFILSAFYREDAVLGSLGVIGPTRMNYLHNIPVVDYIAHMLSAYLNEQHLKR
ncbi:MAG TPA: heat-inducible transcriptional repressor HrcA [Thermodesulfobacteriota bacterium]|nr:heat-inducible transcription repressor HrcA [Deltaproteobacteria bacterium]HNR12519.1 heat-inducible transcriptional repressor HrcA [Thermodesulfobacteriota bacterium]HNU72537.1 heat-inducible transcriptional repressor HrcA [Thermodesulfobacteriota bacterium]HOC38454.1 heat-inducible transcriptional repressor HrcA [Thermodesulfobacteriota bacterium]